MSRRTRDNGLSAQKRIARVRARKFFTTMQRSGSRLAFKHVRSWGAAMHGVFSCQAAGSSAEIDRSECSTEIT